MKVTRYYDVGDFRYEDMELKALDEGEILLKMGACGLCGTDVHKAVFKTVQTPVVLGHEVAGEVVQTGSGVREFAVGDRVFVTHHVPCMTCHYCRHGHHTLCRQFLETNIDPGGFAEYIRIPALNVKHCMYKIPPEMSFEEAAMAEPVACCLRGINQVNLQPGDSVLVIGAGPIGIIHLQIALYRMAGRVIVSDLSDFRLRKAMSFGAHAVINATSENVPSRIKELTCGGGVDVIIITAGCTKLLEDAIACVARGGTILIFSPLEHKSMAYIDPEKIFQCELSIIGSYSSSPLELNEALYLLTTKVVNAKAMITHRFALKELEQAINLAFNPRGESLKITIHP